MSDQLVKPQTYKWDVRGVDIDLARVMRIVAVSRDVPVSDLLNDAIRMWLDSQDIDVAVVLDAVHAQGGWNHRTRS